MALGGDIKIPTLEGEMDAAQASITTITGDGEGCEDTPNGDNVENEQTPGLLSTGDLLKYSVQTNDKKQF